MKKIYIDCALHTCSKQIRDSFDERWAKLDASLRRAGFEILNFNTTDLPFNPYNSEISDFVKIADAVVALSGYPSADFSFSARETALRFGKPRFLFVPHESDLALVRSPEPQLFVRCLYQTPDFPAEVLSRYLGVSTTLTQAVA